MKLLILYLCIPFVIGMFNHQSFTTNKYVPPQSIGGGMMSQGGFVPVHNTYVPPQSIGAGMMSQGQIVQKIIPPPSPIIQTIIDIATFTARGSNNEK